MGIQEIIEGKRQWRASMARIKALPPDYEIVYKEIQKYLFKVGLCDVADGCLLSGIVDFFEEGVAAGRGVLELIGSDVAAFCDGLIKDSRARTNTHNGSTYGGPARPSSNGSHEASVSAATRPGALDRRRGAQNRPPVRVIASLHLDPSGARSTAAAATSRSPASSCGARSPRHHNQLRVTGI
ncbi:MAG: DUF1048 domain-containing protein [Streptosporangiaceae bacterium]